MSFSSQYDLMRPIIESELQRAARVAERAEWQELHEMLAYHMGWEGAGAGSEAQGKRIRPILVTLTTAASLGEWRDALPAAVAVELVHNFSLIHDDIQDGSSLRHGRPTVWKIWGVAQAINAGDALFSLAHLALLQMHQTVSATVAIEAARVLQETCLKLTQGQYLDMANENRETMPFDDYWLMVSGKTAALLEACTTLGALASNVDSQTLQNYREFGHALGMAFQVQDDLLGIWGNVALTGKSVDSDLLTRKKTLPVLFGLQKGSQFAQRWQQGVFSPDEVEEFAALLETEGAKEHTQQAADYWTQQALGALHAAQPQGEPGAALFELAERLLNRAK